MVRAGLGIGVCLDVEVNGVDGLVPVEISDARLIATQYMVHLPQRKMISAVKAFLTSAERLDGK
jgi:DNA-binding transcriptional LysR family regulator